MDSGAAYLVSGSVTGDLLLADSDVRLVGAHPEDHAGLGVGLADLTGDGAADMVVGVATQEGVLPGSVHVVEYRGPMDARVDAVSDAKMVAESLPNAWNVARAGDDINGDGVDDIVLGVAQQDVAYVVLGPLRGTMGLADADMRLVAEAPTDAAGAAVASAGDVDGDGIDDVLVGAWLYGANQGSAYLMFGSQW